MAPRFNFYLANHATTPGQLDAQLSPLLEKLVDMGKRVVVRCADEKRTARLSSLFWKEPREGFLAHATPEDGLPPEKQPVFITHEGGNPSGAHVLLRLTGSPEDTDGFEEVIEFFSGLEAEKAAARSRWKMAQQANHHRRFFSHEDGRWQLKSEQGLS